MSTEDDRDEKLIGSSSDTWIILGPRSHSDEESLYSPPPYFPLNSDESYPVWSPSFDIVFNYTDGNTSYSAAANAAAAFWELAITADLPDAGGVDDLRIDSHLGLIGRASDGEGNVLANAGPRLTRAGSNLPYTGEMGIDPPDADNPGLVAIIVHEIGHVLGLPFVGRQRNLVQDIGAETRFVGTAALAEYRTLANNTALTFVPMQGNQGGHWDEGTFGVELLTPSIDTSQFAPLSRMSLAAMRDLGYTVDLGYADPFALGATLSQFRDDRSGNFNSSATVAVNGSVTGAIELAEDNDWYRVSLTAGTTYTFELNGSATDAGTLADPFLALRSLDGGILASNDDNGTNRNARIAYTAAATGTYFLDASAFGSGTGSYTLRALLGNGSAGTVAIDDVSVAEGENGTRLANFTVTRTGGSAAFSVAYATADGTARAGSDYRAASGSLSFADGQNSATVSVVVNGDGDVEPDETFFVNLSGATGGATIADSQGRGTIRNDDTAPRNDDYANGLDDPDRPFGAVRPGGVATGTIEEAGDRDWFRLSLTAGATYTFELNGSATDSGTLADPFLTLRSLDGGLLASNDDNGTNRNARIAYTAAATGTYFLDARAFGSGTGSYTLRALLGDGSAGTVAIDDVSVAEGENGTRLANFTVTRTGGSAAFSVAYATADGTARAGSDYRAASSSLSFADGQNSATVSVVVNGDGDVEPDETFFVNLSGATGGATIADSQGRGTIRNDDTAPRNDDYANGLDDPDRPFGAVRLGGVATGTLEQAGDRDWFRVRLTAGQSYVMQVSGLGSEAGSLVDAYLRVYTSAGAVTAENDDSGPGRDARVSFTAQTSGTYYLEAGAYRDAAPGTYQVSVDPLLRPDPDGNPLVYDSYYLAANPDVAAAGLDPDAHYAQYGWREGRDPNPFFSTNGYRAANGDVRAAGINPLDHYAQYGWREGRDPSARFDNELYLARNADVRAAGLNPLDHFIRYGQAEGRESYAAVGRAGDIGARNGFDAQYYLLDNPDVAAAALITGGNGPAFALNHYRTNGWREGRDPNAVFDTRGYLNAYADVRAAGLDPLEHYDRYGWREGRDPSATFDTSAYLAAYADVRAANLDPMVHYLQNGRLEGRSPFADGSFGRDQTG